MTKNMKTIDEFKNKIILGDCLEVMSELPDKSIDMILCDLPYGVTARNEWDSIIPLTELWMNYHRVIKGNGAIVLTSIQPFTSVLVTNNLKDFKYEWVWRKQQGTGFLNAKKQPLRNHESILVFYQKQPTYNPQFMAGKPYKCLSGKGSLDNNKQIRVVTENLGIRYPLTVLDFAYDKNKTHPTQKPVALFEYLIKTYTNEGEDIVLDNCIGSGTTAIACISTNRNYIGIEKEEKYVEIANKRINEVKNKLI